MSRKRSWCPRPSREMVTPRVSYVHKHTCPQPDQRTPGDQVARGSVTLPYISGLSESIHRVLAPLAIQVTFCPCRTLRQELVHPKDPVPANHRKGVVYSIPCAECPRTYIGQTGRSLDHRLREHRRALKNGDLGSSALAEHVFSANHRVDLSKAIVIDSHNHITFRSLSLQPLNPLQANLNFPQKRSVPNYGTSNKKVPTFWCTPSYYSITKNHLPG